MLDRPPGQALPPPPAEPHGYEKKTGWKYSITCTNITDCGIGGVPGSHHPQYIDVINRDRATVETAGVRTAKAMGLRNLPSKTWQVNAGWVLAVWTRLLGHCDDAELAPARHARQRSLAISPGWPWTEPFLACWHRLCALQMPA